MIKKKITIIIILILQGCSTKKQPASLEKEARLSKPNNLIENLYNRESLPEEFNYYYKNQKTLNEGDKLIARDLAMRSLRAAAENAIQTFDSAKALRISKIGMKIFPNLKAFKIIYRASLESFIKISSEIITKSKNCSTYKEYGQFLQVIAPDKVSNLPFLNCNSIQILSKPKQNLFKTKLPSREITNEKNHRLDLSKDLEYLRVTNSYDSSKVYKILMLKLHQNYSTSFRKTELSESRNGLITVRFISEKPFSTYGEIPSFCIDAKKILSVKNGKRIIKCYYQQWNEGVHLRLGNEFKTSIEIATNQKMANYFSGRHGYIYTLPLFLSYEIYFKYKDGSVKSFLRVEKTKSYSTGQIVRGDVSRRVNAVVLSSSLIKKIFKGQISQKQEEWRRKLGAGDFNLITLHSSSEGGFYVANIPEKLFENLKEIHVSPNLELNLFLNQLN